MSTHNTGEDYRANRRRERAADRKKIVLKSARYFGYELKYFRVDFNKKRNRFSIKTIRRALMSVIWEYIKEIFELNDSAVRVEGTLLHFSYGKMDITFDMSSKFLNNAQIGIELQYVGINGYSAYRTIHIPAKLINPENSEATKELKARLRILKNKINQIERNDNRYAVSLGKISNNND